MKYFLSIILMLSLIFTITYNFKTQEKSKFFTLNNLNRAELSDEYFMSNNIPIYIKDKGDVFSLLLCFHGGRVYTGIPSSNGLVIVNGVNGEELLANDIDNIGDHGYYSPHSNLIPITADTPFLNSGIYPTIFKDIEDLVTKANYYAKINIDGKNYSLASTTYKNGEKKENYTPLLTIEQFKQAYHKSTTKNNDQNLSILNPDNLDLVVNLSILTYDLDNNLLLRNNSVGGTFIDDELNILSIYPNNTFMILTHQDNFLQVSYVGKIINNLMTIIDFDAKKKYRFKISDLENPSFKIGNKEFKFYNYQYYQKK